MGIANPGRLSLGEWVAITRHWTEAHGPARTEAPSEDEFDLAVMQVRGAA